MDHELVEKTLDKVIAERDALRLSLAQRDAQAAALANVLTRAKAAMKSAWYELQPGSSKGNWVQFIPRDDMTERIAEVDAALTPDLQALAQEAQRNAQAGTRLEALLVAMEPIMQRFSGECTQNVFVQASELKALRAAIDAARKEKDGR
jgi:hypothetical protein